MSLSWDTSDGDFDSFDSFVIKLNDETQGDPKKQLMFLKKPLNSYDSSFYLESRLFSLIEQKYKFKKNEITSIFEAQF